MIPMPCPASAARGARAALLCAASLVALACERPPAPADEHRAEAPAPTDRVDIPAPVRRNLGITFARVEPRNVAATLRLPGRFELLPTARREERAPLAGRVELAVEQYRTVEPGQLLYALESPQWRALVEEIAATTARVESMTPLREAHRVHERSLAEKVDLWKARLTQLDELRAAGGGSAAQTTEARATLAATQAELADVMEKDATLQAEEQVARAALRTLEARRDMLLQAAGATAPDDTGVLRIRARDRGVVERIHATSGASVDAAAPILTVIQPERIRFRARGLQADLGRLRDGLAARIAPPPGAGIPVERSLPGTLRLGPVADADDRTVELIVEPAAPLPAASWARAGVAASVEVTVDGGEESLAIPLAAVVRDGATPIIFRRDPANPDRAIRMQADLGATDGRWVVIQSGVRAGDEVVVDGVYQLMLATSGSAANGGHFHSDGTFHEGKE